MAEVRHAFSKHGGNLGTDGSVAYLFNRAGVIVIEPGADEETLMEAALEAGATDFEVEEESGAATITTAWEELGAVVDALAAAGFTAASAEIDMLPTTEAPCDDELGPKIVALIDALDDLDDVQNVFSNAQLDEAALAGD